MGSLREIKDRIGSVRSTLKITSAMKLVASSKLRKAQKAIEALRPYQQALEGILAEVSGNSVPTSCDVAAGPVAGSRTLIVAIASNSSLCGSFNNNIASKVLAAARSRDNVEVLSLGRKMADAMRKASYPSRKNLDGIVARPSYEDAARLSEDLTESFESGKYDEILLAYNHFESASRQVPTIERYLVREAAGTGKDRTDAGDCGDNTPDITDKETIDLPGEKYIFEPARNEIMQELRPKMLALTLFAAILDSAAAEHAARTVAMQTASDNAEEILGDLTLEYNKGRQQKITAEILDLTAGISNEK